METSVEAAMKVVSLRQAERAILIGASGTGKSTLAATLLNQFRVDIPKARICILDTKPRWRAERTARGTSARSVYKRFAKGDTIPGSMMVDTPTDWDLAWDKGVNPSQTVIVQRPQGTNRSAVALCTWAAERFFQTQDARRPSLLYLDEGMDFFNAQGSALGSDIVQRCYRAGREKGLATMIGVQRPKGINLQCLTETSYCALFRINFTEDVKRLYELGWPKDVGPPGLNEHDEESYAFRLWRAGRSGAPLYRLS